MSWGDRLSGAVFVVFGALVAWEALRLGVGAWRQPGPGFFPLSIGLAWIGLGAMLALSRGSTAEAHPARREVASPAERVRWARALLVLGAYGLMLEPLGFVAATLGFITLWLRGLERSRWSEALLVALAATAAAYALFVRWLRVPLPTGSWIR